MNTRFSSHSVVLATLLFVGFALGQQNSAPQDPFAETEVNQDPFAEPEVDRLLDAPSPIIAAYAKWLAEHENEFTGESSLLLTTFAASPAEVQSDLLRRRGPEDDAALFSKLLKQAESEDGSVRLIGTVGRAVDGGGRGSIGSIGAVREQMRFAETSNYARVGDHVRVIMSCGEFFASGLRMESDVGPMMPGSFYDYVSLSLADSLMPPRQVWFRTRIDAESFEDPTSLRFLQPIEANVNLAAVIPFDQQVLLSAMLVPDYLTADDRAWMHLTFAHIFSAAEDERPMILIERFLRERGEADAELDPDSLREEWLREAFRPTTEATLFHFRVPSETARSLASRRDRLDDAAVLTNLMASSERDPDVRLIGQNTISLSPVGPHRSSAAELFAVPSEYNPAFTEFGQLVSSAWELRPVGVSFEGTGQAFPSVPGAFCGLEVALKSTVHPYRAGDRRYNVRMPHRDGTLLDGSVDLPIVYEHQLETVGLHVARNDTMLLGMMPLRKPGPLGRTSESLVTFLKTRHPNPAEKQLEEANATDRAAWLECYVVEWIEEGRRATGAESTAGIEEQLNLILENGPDAPAKVLEWVAVRVRAGGACLTRSAAEHSFFRSGNADRPPALGDLDRADLGSVLRVRAAHEAGRLQVSLTYRWTRSAGLPVREAFHFRIRDPGGGEVRYRRAWAEVPRFHIETVSGSIVVESGKAATVKAFTLQREEEAGSAPREEDGPNRSLIVRCRRLAE